MWDSHLGIKSHCVPRPSLLDRFSPLRFFPRCRWKGRGGSSFLLGKREAVEQLHEADHNEAGFIVHELLSTKHEIRID